MDGISKKSIAASAPFRFLVGPDKQEFMIHSYLVAQQSPALETLVHGRFKEALDCSVEWDDVDEKTFLSFWHYVYTGNYNSPNPPVPKPPAPESSDPTLLESPSKSKKTKKKKYPTSYIAPTEEYLVEEPPEPECIAEEPIASGWRLSSPSYQSKPLVVRGAKLDALWADFSTSWCRYPEFNLGENTLDMDDELKEYSDLFIYHCRVYILADRYDISRLKKLSFYKLHQALLAYDIPKNEPREIIPLIRFCFEELAPQRLKQMIVHYTACKVEELWKIEEFQDLLEDYGSLSRLLIGFMIKRLD